MLKSPITAHRYVHRFDDDFPRGDLIEDCGRLSDHEEFDIETLTNTMHDLP
jgi:hypothetical protein